MHSGFARAAPKKVAAPAATSSAAATAAVGASSAVADTSSVATVTADTAGAPVGAASEPTAAAASSASSTPLVKVKGAGAGAGGGPNRPRVEFDVYLEALKRYKEIHGDLFISRFFVVPENTTDWPVHMWGLKLGDLLREVKRGRSHQERKNELASIGYDLDSKGMGRASLGGSPRYPYEVMLSAFRAYKEVYKHLKVPVNFIIPDGDNQYPEATWGIPLGRYTQEIRQGAYLKNRRDELIEMGFAFSSQVRSHDTHHKPRTDDFPYLSNALLFFPSISSIFLVFVVFVVY